MPRPRSEPRPLKWVTPEEAFEPQIKVQARKSISGYVGPPKNRVKWDIPAWWVGYIDAPHAREFQVKGYVTILEGTVEPVSEQEAAEMLAQVHVIGLGGNNG
jgi:hypothetical protein